MTDSVTLRQQLAALHQQGFVLLPAVLDPAGIAALREAIDGLEPIHWDYQGLVDDHYKCVFNRSPFWLRFLDLPGVIELAEAALGTDCHIIGQTAWRSRYLLQIHYGRRMVAQKFSPYLHFRFNPEVLAAATPRQRRLLGEHEAAEYD
ncbi:hypothetical protein [Stutzerimonas stutzeri]|uniref:hypothetical protein n=1 Tax=Stutzerimonas stutzeri TaxID=316 RepID=UPI00244A6802|nr:hypothetical protein [Stutzerimonas stutzeri]MDH0154079.1 hypothetical protein [Stutzerimonas stutzeri]